MERFKKSMNNYNMESFKKYNETKQGITISTIKSFEIALNQNSPKTFETASTDRGN